MMGRCISVTNQQGLGKHTIYKSTHLPLSSGGFQWASDVERQTTVNSSPTEFEPTTFAQNRPDDALHAVDKLLGRIHS